MMGLRTVVRRLQLSRNLPLKTSETVPGCQYVGENDKKARRTLLVLHLLDVRSGYPAFSVGALHHPTTTLTSKGTLAPGQNHRPHTVVIVESLDCVVELRKEGRGERVKRLRAVERDEANTVRGARGEYELVLFLGRHEADAEGHGVSECASTAKNGGSGG